MRPRSFAVLLLVAFAGIVVWRLRTEGRPHESALQQSPIAEAESVREPGDDTDSALRRARTEANAPSSVIDAAERVSLPEPTEAPRFQIVSRETRQLVVGAEIRYIACAEDFSFPDENEPGFRPEDLLEELTIGRELSSSSGGAAGPTNAEVPRFVVVRKQGFASIALVWPAPAIVVLEDALGLAGSVLDVDGQPFEGAHIVAVPFPVQRENGLDALPRLLVGESTNSVRGSFQLRARSDCGWTVRAFADDLTTVHARVYPGDERVELRFSGPRLVQGMVLDPEDEPIAGAKLVVDSRAPMNVSVVETRSDAEGMFFFEAAPSGPARLGVYADGFGFEKLVFDDSMPEFVEIHMEPEGRINGRVVDLNGQPMVGAVVHVSDVEFSVSMGSMPAEEDGSWYMPWLRADHHFRVDIDEEGHETFEAGPFSPGGDDIVCVLLPYGAIEGKVTDESGTPIKSFQAQVLPIEPSRDQERRYREQDRWHGFDSENGEFRIDPARPVPSRLRIEARGFAAMEFDIAEVPAGSTTRHLKIELHRGRTIQGRLVDTAGNPIGGASVDFARTAFSGEPTLGTSLHRAPTAADGRFELSGAPDSIFDLVLDSPTHGRRFVRDRRAADFPMEFVFEEPGALEGRVALPWVSQTFAAIRLHPPDAWAPIEVSPDEDGRFRCAPLAPGSYRVEMLDLVHFEEWRCTDGSSQWIDVQPGETAFVELSTAAKGRIEGWLRVEDQALSAAGFRASVLDPSTGRTIATTAVERLGRFVVPGLEPGEYDVRLVSDLPGVTFESAQRVTLSAQSLQERVEFTVTSTGLRGEVRSLSGEPLVASVLLLRDEDGEVVCRTRTNAAGEYRLLGQSREHGLLVVTAAGHAAEERILPSMTRATELRHTLEPEARIHVRVVDESGMAIAGAAVECVHSEGRSLHERCTPDGARFTRLASGSWTLSARLRGFLPSEALTAKVVPGDDTLAVLTLVRPGTLEVQVRASDPARCIGVEVRVTGDDSAQPISALLERTDVDGIARFEGVRPGIHLVSTQGASVPVTIVAGRSERCELILR